MSGMWIPIERDVSPGFHVMEWRYSKYNNLVEQFQMEDLAAEIQYIKVKGVSYTPKECKKCHKGIANFEQSKCEVCPKNEYLDDLAAAGGDCKKCPETHYSPPGSIGLASCIPRKPCTKDDYTHSFT